MQIGDIVYCIHESDLTCCITGIIFDPYPDNDSCLVKILSRLFTSPKNVWFHSEQEAWDNYNNYKKEQMGMKIVSEQKTDISVYSMKDGDIGVITKWYHDKSEYVGRIVQRYENALIALGKPRANSWPDLFSSSTTDGKENFRVRILNKGTQLEI